MSSDPVAACVCGEINTRHCPVHGQSDVAALCHVYCVSHHVLPIEELEGDCWACGKPLAEHAKSTSSLVPVGKVFVIDEKEIRL